MVTRVRPAFRKWLRILLPPIVLVFGWILWGDAEVRRYQQAVADLERRAPPTSPAPSLEDGSRFYAAAAVLAEIPAMAVAVQTAGAMRDALVAGSPADSAIQQAANETLRLNEPTLAVVDQASELQVPGVMRSSVRAAALRSIPVWSTMAPVMSLRTLDFIARGQDGRAAASLVSSIRFLRGASADTQSLAATQQANVVRGLVADLAVMLQRSTLSAVALDDIDRAVADLVRPGDLQRLILGQAKFRYSNVSVYSASGLYGDLIRPARYRVATGIAKIAAEALDVAAQPWPDRVRGMAGLHSWNTWFAPSSLRTINGDANRQLFQWIVGDFATSVAAVNVARTAIAIERHRQAHGGFPESLSQTDAAPEMTVDPFTGSTLRYRRRQQGYVLYSVGQDGRDDGGDVGPIGKAVVPGGLGKDVGMRVEARAATASAH